ncbi:hypothetical protein LTR27_012711 [Elasticomyces elasticus]|nr:hypothetical protein LTR27_012711 [Elasticomyces elasticus]
MIRNGKAAGWLQLPSEASLPWARLNSIAFTHVLPGVLEGKGGALVSNADMVGDVEKPQTLMAVPRPLILSRERILEHAKVDQDFREVLESLGEFGTTSRGAILVFLLMQASLSCPSLPERAGVHSPFTDYVKALPLEELPTFWTPSELQLLVGTTLAPAIAYKLKSLHREYDMLREATKDTRWFRAVHDAADFDDWLQVDAMYRSRALDFPGIGHCMVPAIDLANHTAGEATIAIYEKDEDGNAVLLLRNDKPITRGDEVTITYGDEKGACEMLFSYGFLEHDRQSAETLFLSLSVPENDPYRAIKMQTAECAPGFKLIDAGDGEMDWKGEFIWLLCVTEDDGLHFDLARTVDGEEEVHAFFGEHELTGGAPELYTLLGKSELWDVYRLRAVAILQQRVFDQMQVLYGTQDNVEATPHGHETGIRDRCYDQAMQLRRLEFELLERAYEDFEKQVGHDVPHSFAIADGNQKIELADSEIVQRYLAQMSGVEPEHSDNPTEQVEDDFS